MPLTSSLDGAPRLLVVAPDARPGRRHWALRALVGWLGDHLEHPPSVLCWQTGPLASGWAGDPVIDAGAVNHHWAARALRGLGLAWASRAVKSARLRRLVAEVDDCDRVVLGAASTLPVLDWLTDRPNRRVALWLGDDELDALDRRGGLEGVVRTVDVILAAGPRVADALRRHGVDERRWRRVAEPLVEAAPGPAASPGGRSLVVMVGGPDGVAGAVDAAVAAAVATGTEVAWAHLDEPSRDRRWTDPRFAGLEAQVADVPIEHLGSRLDEVAAVLLAGPTPTSIEDGAAAGRLAASPPRLALQVALQGIPVLGLGATEDTARPFDDARALRAHLQTLLGDPTAWSAAGAAAADRAAPHRIDVAGPRTVDALHLDLRTPTR